MRYHLELIVVMDSNNIFVVHVDIRQLAGCTGPSKP